MTTSLHDQILEAVAQYVTDQTKFEEKGVGAAAARARASLGALQKLAKARRAEIQAKRNEKKEAK